MKQCPKCHRTYSDTSIAFCLEDGSLLSAPYPTQAGDGRPSNPPTTLVMDSAQETTLPAIGSRNQESTITAVNIPVHAEKPALVSTPGTQAPPVSRRWQFQVAMTSFFALFAIV